jgi:hypothetical protein
MRCPHLWFAERAKVARNLRAANFILAVISRSESNPQRAKLTYTFFKRGRTLPVKKHEPEESTGQRKMLARLQIIQQAQLMQLPGELQRCLEGGLL